LNSNDTTRGTDYSKGFLYSNDAKMNRRALVIFFEDSKGRSDRIWCTCSKFKYRWTFCKWCWMLLEATFKKQYLIQNGTNLWKKHPTSTARSNYGTARCSNWPRSWLARIERPRHQIHL